MNLGLETTNSRPHASMTTVRPGGAGLDGLRRFEERRSSWGPTSGPPRAKNPPPLRNGPRSNRGEPRGDFGTGNPETRSSRGFARTLSRTYGSSPGRVEEGLLGNPPRNESNPSRPKGASEGASENAENAAARPPRLALNKRADELAPANVRSRRPLSRGSEAGCGVRTRVGEGDPPARGGWHLFLSHIWKHAQDQCGTLKSLLHTMLPSCRVFLDVDDLKVQPTSHKPSRPNAPASSLCAH